MLLHGAPQIAPTTAARGNIPGGAPSAAYQNITVFVLVVATLYFGKEVLLPLTLALILAFLLTPLVALLRRWHLGRVPSVLLAVVMALGIVVGIGSVIGTQIAQLTSDLPQYATTVETKIDTVRNYTIGRLSDLADRVGSQKGKSNEPAEAVLPKGTPASAMPAPLELAARYLSPVLSPFATFGIVFVVAVFALLQKEDLRDRLIRILGSDDLHRSTVGIDDAGRRLSRYFLTQLSINSVFGVVIGVGLLMIGVPNPILFATLSAMLRFVPYVGAIISALLPMALAAAVDPGWSLLAWTAGLYLVVEGLTGQVIEPLVYGNSTGLTPFSVVIAAIFWSWLWGPIGLILSTPLTLCLVIMGRHIKPLAFMDMLLGDRPALTPVESFYQRILVGDADETQALAEHVLKEHALSTYYDEVAIKGLQLASSDAKRGVLAPENLERIRETVGELLESLADFEDVQPETPHAGDRRFEDHDVAQELPQHTPPPSVADEIPPNAWAAPGSVLCIAGRGPLDEAATAMLAQLLGKHGMGSRQISHVEVSRNRVTGLDVEGVRMVCISYLDISGSPAHLRYLVQRLRRRLPAGTPILVGLWPAGEAGRRDSAFATTIGAQHLVGSLAGAVAACVEEAKGRKPCGILAAKPAPDAQQPQPEAAQARLIAGET